MLLPPFVYLFLVHCLLLLLLFHFLSLLSLQPSEATEELDDEFLLVAVPGSAYSLGFPGNVADEKGAE